MALPKVCQHRSYGLFFHEASSSHLQTRLKFLEMVELDLVLQRKEEVVVDTKFLLVLVQEEEKVVQVHLTSLFK